MKPTSIDPDGVPVFTNIQIDDYGFPEHWGYEVYRVVESRDMPMVMDYKMEREMYFQPKHRYSRLARFKVTLFNLLGDRGKIPPTVISMCKAYLKPNSTDKWNDTRKVLKHFKQRKYYDNIPMIVRALNYGRCFPSLTGDQIEQIITDFMFLSFQFDQKKHEFKRRHFPNIRFIVLMILEQRGIFPNYPIPFIRTERKRKSLSELWDQLVK